MLPEIVLVCMHLCVCVYVNMGLFGVCACAHILYMHCLWIHFILYVYVYILYCMCVYVVASEVGLCVYLLIIVCDSVYMDKCLHGYA